MSSPTRWTPGQTLRVLSPPAPGHHRVPGFIEGHRGVVVRDWGDFPDPCALAQGRRDAPPIPVYLLAFEPRALWPDAPAAPGDRVLVDVHGPWLARD